MTRAFLSACLLAGLFSGPALAQEDYISPLAGIKSVDDLVNGAVAPAEADEDDGAFDGLWFDDAERQRQREGFSELRALMDPGDGLTAAERAADLVLSHL